MSLRLTELSPSSLCTALSYTNKLKQSFPSCGQGCGHGVQKALPKPLLPNPLCIPHFIAIFFADTGVCRICEYASMLEQFL